MSYFKRLFLALSLWVTLAFATFAQDTPAVIPIDYEAWSDVATRAESAIDSGKASNEAFESLRLQVVVWRDQFLQAQDANAPRRATLKSQIEGLGPVPADGVTEDEEIAARRTELNEQLATARAPIVRAGEAYNRADGIIGEIDKIVRDRQANELLSLGPSPLNPTIWVGALNDLQRSLWVIVSEPVTAWQSETRRESFRDALPKVLLYLLIGIVLFFRGGRILAVTRTTIEAALPKRSHKLVDSIWSFAEIALPIAGIYAFVAALEATGMMGLRGYFLTAALPEFGFYALGAYWLGRELFIKRGFFSLTPEGARSLHRSGVMLGVLYGLNPILEALSEFEDFSPETFAVLYFPFAVLAGMAMWRMGQVLVNITKNQDEDEPPVFGLGWLSSAGRITMLFAVLGVILVGIGYLEAGLFLIRPTIGTLGLVGVLFIVTGLVRQIYEMIVDTDAEAAASALVPTLLSMLVVLSSLPLFALIWGARVADLTELWARVREGFTIGESRISPEKFLTFVLVFMALMIATRVIQGALRSTVLPKTKMDTGGQTAIVSGVGYIGIFLAALISITTAGIDLSSLAIVAGALSVGIGFGLQNIVQNFVSGIILLIERPVAEGDWIEVGGNTGIVKKISVRSTLIETFDRFDVIVPNGDFIAGAVKNWTRVNNVGRVKVAVGVAYGNDTRRVAEILSEIAMEHPLVSVNPAPGVDFLGFGADSLDFQIRAVLSDVNYSMSVKTEMHHRINERFAEEGIEIPFGQRDIWLRNPEALQEAVMGGSTDDPSVDDPKGAASKNTSTPTPVPLEKELDQAQYEQSDDPEGEGR